MESTKIQILRTSFQDDVEVNESNLVDGLLSGENDRRERGQSLTISGSSESHVDFTISWSESRLIRGMLSRGVAEDAYIEIQREVQCRLCIPSSVVMCIGLGRQISKFLQVSWPNKDLRPSYLEHRIDLTAVIHHNFEDVGLKTILTDISIDNIPVDQIPSVTLNVKKCKLRELRDLVAGTNATIRKVSINTQEDCLDTIALSNRGFLGLKADFVGWEDLLACAESFLLKLGVIGEL